MSANSYKLGRTGSRNKSLSLKSATSTHFNQLEIPSAETTNPATAISSRAGSTSEPKTGVTTVMSSEGSASGGSGSADVPHLTENRSNLEHNKRTHITTRNSKHTSSSPRKKSDKPSEEMSKQNGLDNFQTLSSTKQNVELFKILTAIAVEIDCLQKSTEKRFSLIESLVGNVQDQQQAVNSNLNVLQGVDKQQQEDNDKHSKVGQYICIYIRIYELII